MTSNHEWTQIVTNSNLGSTRVSRVGLGALAETNFSARQPDKSSRGDFATRAKLMTNC